MSLWLDLGRRMTARTDCWQQRARLLLEVLEDRCLLSAVGYNQVNLASDVPGLAAVTVPNVVNAWGLSYSPTGPFWLANNGTGVSNLLRWPRASGAVDRRWCRPRTARQSSLTGTVFNGGPGFAITANGVTAPSRILVCRRGWHDLRLDRGCRS